MQVSTNTGNEINIVCPEELIIKGTGMAVDRLVCHGGGGSK
jgi:hypothetical protein